tara:strand:+ start:525 stop:1478 length:954 start_codon:yes stop_codon:yes gene_type:complete
MIPSSPKFYGDQTRWFVGRVISINDPLEMGRIKVRIVGIHDNPEIADGELPWAQIVVPVTEGGSSGLGATTGIKEQAQVFGIFLDGEHSQLPMVVGSMPKFESDIPNPGGNIHQPNIPSHQDPAINKNLLPPDRVDEENLYGATNIEKAYNFLITKEGLNLSPIAASGVLGNFCEESGARANGGDINPIAVSGIPGEGSFGIAQWNPSPAAGNRLGALQEFATSLNLTFTSLYAQLLWTRKELTTLPYLGLSELKRAQTPKEATLIFMRKFERPGYQEQRISPTKTKKIVGEDGAYKRLGEEERIEFAEEIYRKFEG